MADEDIPHLAAPDPSKETSPIDEDGPNPSASCMWNGESYPEWYRHCRNGRVYRCEGGRWRNTGMSC